MRRALLAVAVVAVLSTGISTVAHATPPLRAGTVCQGFVALTYDDGPTGITRPLVDALRQNGLLATFFVVGEHVRADPEAVRYAEAAGNEIGNHTNSHPHLTEMTLSTVGYQITEAENAIRDATGADVRWMRPPYGDTNDEINGIIAAHELGMVVWTLDTNDWQGKSAEEIAGVVGSAKDGDVVLMHDDDEIDLQAVPLIADALASKGLCSGELTPTATPSVAWEGLSFNAKAGPWINNKETGS